MEDAQKEIESALETRPVTETAQTVEGTVASERRRLVRRRPTAGNPARSEAHVSRPLPIR